MTIKIDNLRTSNSDISLSMAESISGLLETAGIHNTLYRYKEFAFDSETWQRTANTDDDGNVVSYDLTSPDSVITEELITFTVDGSAIVDVNIGYNAWIYFGDQYGSKSCGVGFVDSGGETHLQIVNGAGVPLLEWPNASIGNIRIAFKQETNHKLEVEYKMIAVYQDGEFVLAHTINNSSESTRVILVATAALTTFSQLRMAEAGYVNDYTTLDPGEIPGTAISRVVGGAPLSLYARYDMSVVILRTDNDDPPVDLTGYYNETAARSRKSINYRNLRSALRLVSAYPEAEYYHSESLDKVGTQFDVAQNPYILTSSGAYNEAVRAQAETVQEFVTNTTQIALCPIVEAFDNVKINDDKYRIDGADITFSPGTFDGSYTLKQYYSAKDVLDE